MADKNMSIKCDFCGNDTIATENVIFIAGENGVHICEKCIRLAADRVVAAKNKKNTDQSWQEIKDKLAEMAGSLANHD